MAEIKRLNLGHLNPVFEMERNKPDVHQVKGRRNVNVSRDGEGGKGCRHRYPERGEMRVPTVEGEGGAQGERERATATAFPKPIAALCFQKY